MEAREKGARSVRRSGPELPQLSAERGAVNAKGAGCLAAVTLAGAEGFRKRPMLQILEGAGRRVEGVVVRQKGPVGTCLRTGTEVEVPLVNLIMACHRKGVSEDVPQLPDVSWPGEPP
jgi:hypothetical protein